MKNNFCSAFALLELRLNDTGYMSIICRIKRMNSLSRPTCIPGHLSLIDRCSCVAACLFSTGRSHLEKPLPPRPKINEADITENFIKGGGSGGQKINKTNSLVQLLHHPTGLTIKCQATRSRAQNRTIARRRLAERLEELEQGDESRVKIKEDKARRKKANAAKKSKRKYKMLDSNVGAEPNDEAALDRLQEGGAPAVHSEDFGAAANSSEKQQDKG